MNNAVLSSAIGKNPAGTRVALKIGESAMQKIDAVVDPETSDRKLSRLCWEVADAIDEQGNLGRFEYVTIRGAKEAGRAAVMMGFDIDLLQAVDDPLLTTIGAYRKGLADFEDLANAAPDSQQWDEFETMTFGPPLSQLQQWEGPARSKEGAAAALRIALDENGLAGMDAADRMVKAALEYLEGSS